VAVRFTAGGVLRVPLAGERFAYAVMMAKFPYFAFYLMGTKIDEQDGVDGQPLFVVAVQRNAYSGGRWGSVLLRLKDSDLPSIPPFFRQNVMRPDDCEIVEPTGVLRKVSPAECIGLEPDSVWAAIHIESRLEDYYANRPNVFVESTRLKL
jgi:hypothetical protein